MKVILNDTGKIRPSEGNGLITIDLDPTIVKASKKMVTSFLKKVQDISNAQSLDTIYFTTLIIMHVMSQNLLEAIDPSIIQELVDKNKK